MLLRYKYIFIFSLIIMPILAFTDDIFSFKDNNIYIKGNEKITQDMINNFLQPQNSVKNETSDDIKVLLSKNYNNALKESKNNNENAFILSRQKVIKIDPFGTSRSHDSVLFFIKNANSFTENILSFAINLQQQNAIIYHAAILNKKNEYLNLLSLDNLYANLNNLSLQLKGDLNDALIYFEYEISEKNPKKILHQFNSELFTKNYELKITYPVNDNFSFITKNIDTSSKVAKELDQNFKAIAWHLKDIKKDNRKNATVLIVSPKYQDEIIAHYKKIIEKNLIVSQEFSDFVKEIVKEQTSKIAITKTLYHWIQKNITLYPANNDISTVEQILQQRSGSGSERALLLIAMLKSLNISADLALYSNKNEPDDFFGNTLVICQNDNSDFFLDLNQNFNRFPFLPQELIQCEVLNLANGKISIPSDPSSFISAIDTNIHLQINLDEKIVKCTREDLFQGRIESFYRRRLTAMQQNERVNELQRGYNIYNNIIEKFEITDPLNYETPLSFKTLYTRKNAIIKLDDQYLLYLPELTNVNRGVRPLYERNRARMVTINITVPENLTLVSPEILNISMPQFQSEFSLNITINNSIISIKAYYLSTLNNRKTNQDFFQYEQQINRILEKPLIFQIKNDL